MMSTHAAHSSLPGYDPGQILVDGCRECERRGSDAFEALTHLDVFTFQRAWERAAEWQLHGLPTLSHAESRMLSALMGVVIQFERLGWPFGVVPRPIHLVSGDYSPAAAAFLAAVQRASTAARD
jgi:hypothetical protein